MRWELLGILATADSLVLVIEQLKHNISLWQKELVKFMFSQACHTGSRTAVNNKSEMTIIKTNHIEKNSKRIINT